MASPSFRSSLQNQGVHYNNRWEYPVLLFGKIKSLPIPSSQSQEIKCHMGLYYWWNWWLRMRYTIGPYDVVIEMHNNGYCFDDVSPYVCLFVIKKIGKLCRPTWRSLVMAWCCGKLGYMNLNLSYSPALWTALKWLLSCWQNQCKIVAPS